MHLFLQISGFLTKNLRPSKRIPSVRVLEIERAAKAGSCWNTAPMQTVGVQRENMKKIVIAIAALQACGILSAAELTCYEEPRTNAYQCFDEKQVREKDGIRSATLYTGGPNGVDKTSFTINVNCGTQIVHLKDRQGVSFAGGYGSETEALKSLRAWICEAKPITAKGKK